MTTPTQAQIEAAAKAIEKLSATDPIVDVSFADIAKAALTAAAEVGGQQTAGKDATVRRLMDEIERLRAVEKSAMAMCDSYADENQRFHDEIDKLRAENAATIERCAQVVENFDLSLEYRVRDTIKAIAAEIRALKEGP